MDTILDYAQQSELALAAYAYLDENFDNDEYKDELERAGFADTQADAFIARYSVVDQFSPSNGLSVTVFEDKQTNQKYLAVRGTEPSNWWSDIAIADGLNIAILGGTTFMSQYHSLVNKVIEWQLDGTLPSSYTVAGHSLGGFLAAALTNANPNNISHAYLYNAPGFGGLDESWLAGLSWVTGGMARAAIMLSWFIREALGTDVVPEFDASKFTNLKAEAGISPIALLGEQPSPPIWVQIENQFQGVTNAPDAMNHSQEVITQSLMLYQMFAYLDPNLTMEQIGGIIAAQSKNNIKLELTLDAVRKLLLVNDDFITVDQTPEGNKNSFYENLYNLLNAEIASDITIAPFASFNSSGDLSIIDQSLLIQLAETNIAYTYAVVHGNTFVVLGSEMGAIYEQHNQNGELNFEVTYDAEGNLIGHQLTDQYLEDRAAYLVAMMQQAVGEDPSIGTTSYKDLTTNTVITNIENNSIPFEGNNIVFGKFDEENTIGFAEGVTNYENISDCIYGGIQNDTISALGGNDTLIGGLGDDTLEGGTGIDTYMWNEGDGIDTIIETDESGNTSGGALLINGQTLTNIQIDLLVFFDPS